MPAANRPICDGPHSYSVGRPVAEALAEMKAAGAVTGTRSQRISVRVDPGVMRAAAVRLGLTNPSDVVNASLAVAAAPDQFKAWWAAAEATLPGDFELAV